MPLPLLSNKYQSKTSKELNKSIPLELGQNFSISYPNEIIRTIDAAKLYNSELDFTTKYRISAGLSLFASNALVNITGNSSFETILELRNYDETDEVFEFTQEEVLLNSFGWWYYLTGETISPCQRVYMEPTPDKFSFLPNPNWGIYLSYPEKSIDTLELDGVPLSSGVRVNSMELVTLNNRQVTKVITSIPHGLSTGDNLLIYNLTTQIEKSYFVYMIGDENNNYLENAFLIDDDSTPYDPMVELISIKKITSGVSSRYYARYFKKLTTDNDIKVYPTAFSKSLFSDPNTTVTFEPSIDIDGLQDNLGRPISQLYISIVKKPLFTDPNTNFWTPVIAGIESIFAFSQYDINTIISQGIETLNSSDDYFFGDICEWNPITQEEKTLVVAQHRFNSQNREDNSSNEGYWYQPHYLIGLKEYSDVVSENLDPNLAPSWATLLEGRYLWREQKQNSIVNIGTFLNSHIYLWSDINLYLRRQDPCDDFGLGLMVITGDCVTFEEEIKNNNEIC